MSFNFKQSYRIIHRGALALAKAERKGINIDVEYVEKERTRWMKMEKDLTEEFFQSEIGTHWKKRFGAGATLQGNEQVAYILYDHLGLRPPGKQPDKLKVDQEALNRLSHPVIPIILRARRINKTYGTYLEGILREVNDDGFLRPSFILHKVITFRSSCVAKGTPVLVMRDFEKHPNGVPIETVKAGDFVYCFDNQLKPAIRRVNWAGKTGHREVVRIHWNAARGRTGYVDVTPEHKIRHVSGKWIEAQNLMGDLRGITDSSHSPKCRVLSCNRSGDKLNFTCSNNIQGHGVHEHRLIYQQMIGDISEEDVIHHIDKKHLNHTPSNLSLESIQSHGLIHGKDMSPELLESRIKLLNDNRHKIVHKSGVEHFGFLNLSRYTCLRQLAKAKGQLTKTEIDFGTIKQYCKKYKIPVLDIKARYSGDGNYITRFYLNSIAYLGRSEVQKIIKRSYYDTLYLYKLYGIDPKRRWGNQYGEFIINNHIITKVEWIKKEVDVYDLEVDEFHNFIAGELCVHNCLNPNFQNIPIRDPEMGMIIRNAFIPRPGNRLCEADYKALEVAIAAAYHKDPTMIEYLTTGYDMHRAMAKECFILTDSMKLTKTEFKTTRFYAKNGFVFPAFYGSYWAEIAANLWEMISLHELTVEGIPMKEHLRKQGITRLGEITKDKITGRIIEVDTGKGTFFNHIKEVEKNFWNNRFPVYKDWKNKVYAEYLKCGYMDYLTGFRVRGIFKKTERTNYPVQGSAFHCLLRTFASMTDWTESANLVNSGLIGQIHDSSLSDIHPTDFDEYIDMLEYKSTTETMEEFPWINVPLTVELEISDTDQSWYNKKEYIKEKSC